jgi:indole-3-glycerol phosphate synthase
MTITQSPATEDVLARICADTRAEVARRRSAMPLEDLRRKISHVGPTRGFGDALKQATMDGRFGLVAELKKASPSGGLIRENFDPAALARAYAEGGATCLSVLTDEPHFQGTAEHLKIARKAVDLPVLRKDFVLDPWQVYESRAMGADCILLILAALADEQASELAELARALDLDVLAEVHNRTELDRALWLQTSLIGINNRNLKTFEVDLATTEALAEEIPNDTLAISESGIRTADDVRRVRAAGVNAVLVGETLMRAKNVPEKLRELLLKEDD